MIGLLVGGVISAVVGAILWISGSNMLSHDQDVADYGRAIGLDNGVDLAATSPQISADQTMIYCGIALVALGVLMILATVIIRAARR